MDLRAAIIGCGLIGTKRAKALNGVKLVAVADSDVGRARKLAAVGGPCAAESDWRKVVGREDVDMVFVATSNDCLVPAALSAVEAGKHVLVEKPGARNADELAPLVEAARSAGVVVKVGFNHRFHPALLKAKSVVDSGALGKLMYVRARYGHGGRLGMEREWRADRSRAGGGEMLDQGVHLIDLSRWFLGEFTEVSGHIGTFFWPMEVEDNGFALLKTAAGQVAFLHASCTEWKNMFSFEIYGRDGKLQVDGLGGSYGVERLTWYRMLRQMGPPETTIWEYPFEDRSWNEELSNFLECIAGRAKVCGGLEDAQKALEIVGRVYEDNRR